MQVLKGSRLKAIATALTSSSIDTMPSPGSFGSRSQVPPSAMTLVATVV
jgi:hypothetical protein